MLICDTSGLVAFFDASEPDHQATVRSVMEDHGPLVVSPYVLAELDYLISNRLGVDNALLVLGDLGSGAWELPAMTAPELREAAGVIERYRDQAIGLTDASLVVLAERRRTDRLLTLDHRHFSLLRTSSGKPFTLLP